MVSSHASFQFGFGHNVIDVGYAALFFLAGYDLAHEFVVIHEKYRQTLEMVLDVRHGILSFKFLHVIQIKLRLDIFGGFKDCGW